MAHHDADAVVILERFGREIAEHPQMAVLTIEAIFGRVMRVKSSHKFSGSRCSIARFDYDYKEVATDCFRPNEKSFNRGEKCELSASQGVTDPVARCRVTPIRVMQQVPYARDTSRANSSKSRIRSSG